MKPKSTELHYQIPTENTMSHTWRQPEFQFLHSDHYNGTRFVNSVRRPEGRSRGDLLKWLIKRKSSTWNVDLAQEYAHFHADKKSLPQDRPHADLKDWQVWFVGHATVLLQIGPYNLLTDPVWAEHVSPKQG